VLKIYGIDFRALDIYMTVFLSLFALLLFKFLSRFFSNLVSILLIIITVYNPWTLSFKGEIVSDIPFAVAVLFSLNLIYSFRRKDIYVNILLCLLISFSILIRSVGIALPLSLLIWALTGLWHAHDAESKKNSWTLIAVAGISLSLYLILNNLVFPVSKGVFNYRVPWRIHELPNIVRDNLTYYTGVLRAFFETWNDKWHFISVITGSMIFTFIILGFIKKISANISFADIFFLVYLAIIFLYPYSNAGFRFLFPLLPVMLLYLVKGINSVDLQVRLNRTILAISLAALTLFTYKKAISNIINSVSTIQEGPQLPENREMFEIISEKIPANAKFSFKRPRALALFTGRSAMTHRPDALDSEIENDLTVNNIEYILINSEDYNQNMIDYINSKKEIKLIWENSHNKIYSIK
jgi:hypothetical protein